MNIGEVISIFRRYQQSNRRKRTVDSYRWILRRFDDLFADREAVSIQPDEIYHFLETLTTNASRSTRRLRYAQLKAFYNFVAEKCCPDLKNPCNAPLLSKTFRLPRQVPKTILDRETVDEMIYNTKDKRKRLILELQARCGLRIGELLNIRVSDVSERRLLISQPKSGKETEMAFMPEQVANRLQDYIKDKRLSPEDRVFPICYSTARMFIKKLGQTQNLTISPHDLRRYSATYASRNGVPLEIVSIVSKVILRHQNLRTTQVYLGRVSEQEAIRWMDILHGR